MSQPQTYLVAGVIVEATKSAGGGFYDVRVVQTDARYRYLAEVFESVAKRFNPACGGVSHIPGSGCADCREEMDKHANSD